VVLIRRSGVLGLLLLGGCGRLLFDPHGGDGGADSGTVPSTCPGGCLGDAATDFNGASGGAGNHWRYLEDHRDRSWAPMAMIPAEMVGTDPANRITTCTARPTAPACSALPGALLMSSAGSQSSADPAIEFTAPTNQVIQLSLHAFVPGGAADQLIRLYRNSREDVLFTGTATPGATLAHAITLDALAGDRFLVAVAPVAGGATDVGLQLFVNATGAPFPSTCQLALPFTSTSGATTTDQCHGAVFTHSTYTPNPSPGSVSPTAVVLGNGPFPEQGRAVDIKPTDFLQARLSDVLDWSHDVTVQFWVQQRQGSALGQWLYSDLDPDFGGGVAVSLLGSGSVSIDVTACTDPTPNMVKLGDAYLAYPTTSTWQFVRVVRTGATVSVCLNGQRMASLPVNPNLPSTFKTYNPPNLGADASQGPRSAIFDGLLDDVRTITGALPCN